MIFFSFILVGVISVRSYSQVRRQYFLTDAIPSQVNFLILWRFSFSAIYQVDKCFNYLLEGKAFENTGKRRKCMKPTFSPFPTMFSTILNIDSSFVQQMIICHMYSFLFKLKLGCLLKI